MANLFVSRAVDHIRLIFYLHSFHTLFTEKRKETLLSLIFALNLSLSSALCREDEALRVDAGQLCSQGTRFQGGIGHSHE